MRDGQTWHGGDKAAFDEMYRELKTPVYTIAYRVTRDRALAEDVTHDVFVKLFQTPPPPVRNPRAWIFRIARNLAIDSVRKAGTCALPETLEDGGPPLEDTVIARTDVEAAMRRLSCEESEIVTLHINAGLKFREIADITGTPLGTVLWRYQRAIGALRNDLA